MAKQVPRITLSFDADDLTKTSGKISMNAGVYQGEILCLYVGIPNWTNNPTGILDVYNKDGINIFEQTGIVKSGGATHYYTYYMNNRDIIAPLIQQETVKFTLDGAAGGTGGSVTIDIVYRPDAVYIA